ncbi:MAG TPA: FAD-dependent monooxygenase, partial [Tahibacter sp.]|nr:FAD-dependent monooxygenase [Tahibacter sp.]
EGRIGFVISEPELGRAAEPTIADLREALVAHYGTDRGLSALASISRFTDATRQAATYRDRRILLAGDAAHVHAPDGGHGLNTGVQDAVNLGWKLAQVVKRQSPETLLDTYHAERHPVGARVLRYTMAATALRRSDERTTALRETIAELLASDDARRRFAATTTGLDIRYDLGDGHPLLGRRMPDLDVVVGEEVLQVYTLLHAARPVLLNLGEAGRFDIAAWSDRVRRVDARYDGAWMLPGIGEVSAPDAVLVRPDGHVAWVGEGSAEGLAEAMTAWFGTPVSA